jgi:hypothetical protein
MTHKRLGDNKAYFDFAQLLDRLSMKNLTVYTSPKFEWM